VTTRGTGRPVVARRQKVNRWLLLALVFAFIVIPFVLPLYWMLVTALRPPETAFSVPPELLPGLSTLSFENFLDQLQNRGPFLLFLRNGIWTSTIAAATTTVVAILAGFALSRVRMPGRKVILILVLASQMVPISLLVVGLYGIYLRFGLLDSFTGQILGFVAFALPFAVWAIRGFFEGVPKQLDEAATIDGASQMQVLRYILLPLAIPGLTSVFIFGFLVAWNNLAINLALTTTEKYRTIPAGFLSLYTGEFTFNWAGAMAGGIIVSLPVIGLLLVSQRYFVSGLTQGAVKG